MHDRIMLSHGKIVNRISTFYGKKLGPASSDGGETAAALFGYCHQQRRARHGTTTTTTFPRLCVDDAGSPLGAVLKRD